MRSCRLLAVRQLWGQSHHFGEKQKAESRKQKSGEPVKAITLNEQLNRIERIDRKGKNGYLHRLVEPALPPISQALRSLRSMRLINCRIQGYFRKRVCDSLLAACAVPCRSYGA